MPLPCSWPAGAHLQTVTMLLRPQDRVWEAVLLCMPRSNPTGLMVTRWVRLREVLRMPEADLPEGQREMVSVLLLSLRNLQKTSFL